MVEAKPAIGFSAAIPFFPGDLELVRDNLNIPNHHLQLLANEMNALVDSNLAAVYSIQKELDKIESLKASLLELRGSENYKLKSAGAITWEGDRAAGMLAEIDLARDAILRSLSVDHLMRYHANIRETNTGFTIV